MRALSAFLAVLGTIVVLSACSGGGGKHKETGAGGHDAAEAATVRTAKCHDWSGATSDERWALVRGMRSFFGGAVDRPNTRGQTMPDQKAYELFVSYCKEPYAYNFNLYRIYGNAAAFTIPSTHG